MSSPASTMRPAVGASTPVSRLTKVVLPAPLGPISACRAPPLELEGNVVGRHQAAEALGEAVGFQRQGHRPTLASTARMPPEHALAADQHDHDQHQADPELPVLRRQGRQDILQRLVDDGAGDAAIEIAGAADDQHQQHVGRAMEVEHVERGEAVVWASSAPAAPA